MLRNPENKRSAKFDAVLLMSFDVAVYYADKQFFVKKKGERRKNNEGFELLLMLLLML